ncbi:MAG: sulfatase [Planctomycetaceae bacterium]
MRTFPAALAVTLLATAAAAADRPNVLLVIADDMAWNDCGPYGSRIVRTPNMDRLAKQGMTFNLAFTATAMCSPTRQQLYTGLFPVRNGAHPNHSRVKSGTKSIVHHLKKLGYRVALTGKKHIGPRASFPFEPGTRKFVTRNSKQPFCLVVASKEPHAPWNTGPKDYDPDKISVPKNLVDNPVTRRSLAAYYSEITQFDSELGGWLKVLDDAKLAKNTIVIVTTEQGPQFPGGKWTCYDYGLHVGFIVRWPGKVKPGSRSNALVQYVDVVPTLIEAAGGNPAKVDTGRAGATDGGRGFDGKSFLDILRGKTDAHHKYVYGVHTTNGIISGKPYPIRSVRDKRYRYIRNLLPKATFQNIITENDRQKYWAAWKETAKTDPRAAALVKRYRRRPAEELYDLETDPLELHNLAADPKYRAKITELNVRLQSWMKQQGDRGVETELAVKSRRKRKKRRSRKNLQVSPAGLQSSCEAPRADSETAAIRPASIRRGTDEGRDSSRTGTVRSPSGVR